MKIIFILLTQLLQTNAWWDAGHMLTAAVAYRTLNPAQIKEAKQQLDFYHEMGGGSMFNPETGEMGLKKNYVGTIVVVQFNREGDIYRKITLDDCFITSGVNLVGELNYESADAVALEVGWKCDTFSEELN